MRFTSTSKNIGKRSRTRLHRRVAFAVASTFVSASGFVVAPPSVVAARMTMPKLLDWPTFGGTPAHAGSLPEDRSFDTRNAGSLKRRWIATFARGADATPIVLSHVPGRRSGDPLVIETDTAGETYGIDGSTGSILWRFETTGPKITASTPVAAPDDATVYVPGVDGRVHALVAATGREERPPGFPLTITRMPEVEKDASPLTLANGYLYAVTSGYIGDAGPYDGHLVAVRLADGTTHVTNSLCSETHALLLDRTYDPHSRTWCAQQRSGIWPRAGAVVDPDATQDGRAYVATGNGAFAMRRRGGDYGDSVVAIDGAGSRVLDSFTPRDYTELERDDADLGSTAPAMLPREARSATPLLAVQGGKGGVLYLLDRPHLGGLGGELQRVPMQGQLFSAPAIWRDASRSYVFLGFSNDRSGVEALSLTTDASGTSRLRRAWTSDVPATSPVVVNGVVFVASSGALHAFDARSGTMLWSSTDRRAGGTIGGIHWQSPVAVNGWLYCSDQSRHLTAYALPNRR